MVQNVSLISFTFDFTSPIQIRVQLGMAANLTTVLCTEQVLNMKTVKTEIFWSNYEANGQLLLSSLMLCISILALIRCTSDAASTQSITNNTEAKHSKKSGTSSSVVFFFQFSLQKAEHNSSHIMWVWEKWSWTKHYIKKIK